jgi:hypothetical protein
MKTRVKRRTKVKRTKRRYCKNKKTRCRYKRRSMRRNLKGGWGGLPFGGKLEEEQYGGWGQAVALV